jgi:hypothetical protein
MGESVVLTENYIHARVRGLRMPPNWLVQIRIDEVEGDAMWGTLVGPPSCQAGGGLRLSVW